MVIVTYGYLQHQRNMLLWGKKINWQWVFYLHDVPRRDPQANPGDVEHVSDKVYNVPQITDVLRDASGPESSDLRPD